ncbi:S-adenosyl-L-methionine-dependent methyltransferase, partial [Cryphonectria parasitica EP155]
HFFPRHATDYMITPDLQHHVWQTMLHGRLFFAPIIETAKVLDIGTGTGIWAIEFARQYPSTTVIGTDISLIQPTENLPSNCRFEREDAEDPWIFDIPFDFIRWRLMATSFSNHQHMIYKVYSNLAPGGWAEFHEWAFEIIPESAAAHEAYQGSALKRWLEYILAGAAALGRDFRAPLQYRPWMVEAGFTEIAVRRFSAPLNKWPLEHNARTLGSMACINCLQLVTSVTKILLAGGLSLEELPGFIDEVRADIRDQNMRVYFPVYVTYGRKPETPVQHYSSEHSSRYIQLND